MLNLRLVFILFFVVIVICVPLYLFNFNSQKNHNIKGTSQSVTQKQVFVVVYDPILSSGQKLSVSQGWYNYSQVISSVQDFFLPKGIDYEIREVKEINDLSWYPKPDGFVYTEASYLAALADSSKAHDPDRINYANTLFTDSRVGLCSKMTSTQYDEVWLIAGPWFGFREWAFAGPSTFADINTISCGNKVYPIMGLNYQVTPVNTLESFLHRVEATLTRVFLGNPNFDSMGYKASYSYRSDIGRFFAQKRHQNIAGCGNIHYSPNTTAQNTAEYFFGHTNSVRSYCEAFKKYPKGFVGSATPVSKLVSCKKWGCTEMGFYNWWFNNIPKTAGQITYDNYVVLNNWQRYIFDMSLFIMPSEIPIIDNLEAQLNEDSAIFSFDISLSSNNKPYFNSIGEPVVQLSSSSTFSADIYNNFAQGVSPVLVSEGSTALNWDKYDCGQTLYWRVRVPNVPAGSFIHSPINSAVVTCN